MIIWASHLMKKIVKVSHLPSKKKEKIDREFLD